MNITFSLTSDEKQAYLDAYDKYVEMRKISGKRVYSQSSFFRYIVEFWDKHGEDKADEKQQYKKSTARTCAGS